MPASQICDNPAHPGTIPIDETVAQELQFQADTANNVLLNLPSPEVRELLLADYVVCNTHNRPRSLVSRDVSDSKFCLYVSDLRPVFACDGRTSSCRMLSGPSVRMRS